MKVNLDELNKRIDEKLINVQQHPTEDLYIYNYTPVCQFGRNWDEYTLMCRGLVLDAAGNVVARPFKKFFNLEEQTERLSDEPFQVTEKLDGSLGILYPTSNDYAIATRGSFTSDQAVMGTGMLNLYVAKHGTDWIDPAYTYLFEIIYPSNRIVVDYGSAQRLVLLAAINTETGDELDIASIDYPDKANLFDTPDALEELRQVAVDNAEGYVIRFQSGLRVKMKFAEYVRLHRLLTQVSNKSIWDLLRRDEPIEPILDNIPDEFYQWVQQTIGNLETEYHRIVDEAMELVKQVPQGVPRKEQAVWITKQKNPHLIFSLLDGKPINEAVWKSIKPKYEKPFKQDIDA